MTNFYRISWVINRYTYQSLLNGTAYSFSVAGADIPSTGSHNLVIFNLTAFYFYPVT